MQRGIDLPLPPPDAFVRQAHRSSEGKKHQTARLKRHKAAAKRSAAQNTSYESSSDDEDFDDDLKPTEDALGGDPTLFVAAEESEEFTDYYLNKHMRNFSQSKERKSDASLSCPACFTLVCRQCQRHETDSTRFRAVTVTSDCTVQPELQYDQEDPSTPYQFIVCGHCSARLGALENNVYHFLNVIPGPN